MLTALHLPIHPPHKTANELQWPVTCIAPATAAEVILRSPKLVNFPGLIYALKRHCLLSLVFTPGDLL